MALQLTGPASPRKTAGAIDYKTHVFALLVRKLEVAALTLAISSLLSQVPSAYSAVEF